MLERLPRHVPNTHVLRRLLSDTLSGNIRLFAVAVGCFVVSAAATSYVAWLFRDVVNGALASPSFATAVATGLTIGAVFAARGCCTYLGEVALARASNHTVERLRVQLYEVLLTSELSRLRNVRTAEVMEQVAFTAMTVSNTGRAVALTFGRDLTTLLFLVGTMLWYDATLFISLIIAAPLGVVGIEYLRRSVRAEASAEYSTRVTLGARAQETLHGIRIIKAMGLESLFLKTFRSDAAEVRSRSDRLARKSFLLAPLVEILGGLAIATVVMYGAWRMTTGSTDPGTLFAFVAAFLLAYDPARRIADFVLQLDRQSLAISTYYSMVPDRRLDPSQKPTAPFELGDVTFQNVSFAYPEGEAILSDVSFSAERGCLTAIVGPSGAGKSTLFNLLLRFYPVAGGAITIASQPIQSISDEAFRAHVAYVPQEAFLFPGTLRNNISLGRPNTTKADVEAAARLAMAHDFIMELPRGYDTEVTELGNQLSGGQRQRISIARALLKSPSILLLDEPTAALDAASEQDLQTTIAHLRERMTILVIAHRLATVMRADKIVVLDRGHVVEAGRHEELVVSGGLYAKLASLQLHGA